MHQYIQTAVTTGGKATDWQFSVTLSLIGWTEIKTKPQGIKDGYFINEYAYSILRVE